MPLQKCVISVILVQHLSLSHLISSPYLHICLAVGCTQVDKYIYRSRPSSDRSQVHISQDPEHIH